MMIYIYIILYIDILFLYVSLGLKKNNTSNFQPVEHSHPAVSQETKRSAPRSSTLPCSLFISSWRGAMPGHVVNHPHMIYKKKSTSWARRLWQLWHIVNSDHDLNFVETCWKRWGFGSLFLVAPCLRPPTIRAMSRATSWLFRQGSLAFQAASTTSFSSSWPLGGGTGCALAFLRMVGGPKVSPWHHRKMLRIKHAVPSVPGRYQHPGCKSARYSS